MRKLLEAARRVKARRKLVGERLVVNEAVRASRADGLFVEPLGVELAAFETRDLGGDQRRPVREVLRTVVRPLLQQAIVDCQCLQVPCLFRHGCCITHRGACERGVEMVLGPLDDGSRGPEKPFGVRGRRDCRSVITREEARLQLPDPVPGLGQRQGRVICQMAFEQALIEPLFVERAECRRQATEGPDEPELAGGRVDDETEPHLPRKRETTLGFALHLIKRIARREKVRVQLVAAERRKIRVAALGCRLERATQRITGSPDMSRPRYEDISKVHIGPGLEAPQPALFDQVIAELAESKSGLVVAEARPGDRAANPHIGEA